MARDGLLLADEPPRKVNGWILKGFLVFVNAFPKAPRGEHGLICCRSCLVSEEAFDG